MGVAPTTAIDEDTRFFADLGLASIDAVVLSEAIQAHYGRPLPFNDLMAEIGRRTDRDLSIGELVAFLRRTSLRYDSSTPGPSPCPRSDANGLNFHYQQAGEGPDVVLIHGVTGDLSIWFLCQAMGVLARSFRVTAFDLRGHGYSDVPASGYTSAEQAGDVIAIMDALEIDRAMLVGHSFGGVIAMHAAVLHPDRIEAVVLSDPCFAALRHLEDLGRWGHWQNFREEAARAGVTLSEEHWYDLGKFFDQVLHLDGERMLQVPPGRRPPGLQPAAPAGRDHLRRRRQGRGGADRGPHPRRHPAGDGDLRRALPVPGDGRLPGGAPAALRECPGGRRQAPRARGESRAVRRAGRTGSCWRPARRPSWRGVDDEHEAADRPADRRGERDRPRDRTGPRGPGHTPGADRPRRTRAGRRSCRT